MAEGDPKGYYAILGVDKTATEEEIKKAYRKQALQWHPDKNSSPEAEQKFKKISQAYQILSDKREKAKYDRRGGGRGAGGLGGFTFGSFGGFGMGSGGFGGMDDQEEDSSFGFSFMDADDLFKSFFGSDPFSQDNDPFALMGGSFKFGADQGSDAGNAAYGKAVAERKRKDIEVKSKTQSTIMNGIKTVKRTTTQGSNVTLTVIKTRVSDGKVLSHFINDVDQLALQAEASAGQGQPSVAQTSPSKSAPVSA